MTAYTQSEKTKTLKKKLSELEANEIAEYSPALAEKLDSLLTQYGNREAFSYNPSSDALYRQYASGYAKNANLAMRDAEGRARAASGGYANSYAQTAGQSAYNAGMEKLSDALPKLYELAYRRYGDEGDALMTQYKTLASEEQENYNRYRDSVSDYQKALSEAKKEYEQSDALDAAESAKAESAKSETAKTETAKAETAKAYSATEWKKILTETKSYYDKYGKSGAVAYLSGLKLSDGDYATAMKFATEKEPDAELLDAAKNGKSLPFDYWVPSTLERLAKTVKYTGKVKKQ